MSLRKPTAEESLFTIWVAWDRDLEEIDVIAKSRKEAQQKAIVELKKGYKPGWKIIKTTRRENGTMFL